MRYIDVLHGDNVSSRQILSMPHGEVVTGKQNVWNKKQTMVGYNEEFHGGDIRDAVVADNHFTSKMSFDVTLKIAVDSKWKRFVCLKLNTVKL